MITTEAREVVQDIVELFSKSSGVAIALYDQDAQGNVRTIMDASPNLFPEHCREVWKLDYGRGKQMCEENMCTRAEVAFKASGPLPIMCHAGLTTATEPIRVATKTIAVVQYGAYVPHGDAAWDERIARHEAAMTELRASKAEAARVRQLLLDCQDDDNERLKSVRESLPPVLNRAITKYVGSIVRERRIQKLAYHDLQIRLAGATFQAEDALDQLPKNSLLRESLRDIKGAIESAATVMHGLTSGRYLPAYTMQRYCINELLENAIDLCRAEAGSKGLRIQTELCNDNEAVAFVSKAHIQQAFNNLTHNAVKYSYRTTFDTAKRFVSIRARPHAGGIEVTFANYGVGIERDEFDQIFKEGYKGRLTKSEYRTGAGQGLALTKQILAKHRATVNVSSEPVGEATGDSSVRPYLTRFVVWLPVAPKA